MRKAKHDGISLTMLTFYRLKYCHFLVSVIDITSANFLIIYLIIQVVLRLFINVRRCHYEMMKYYCDIPCLCSIVLLVCKSICLAHNNQESLALKYTCFNHLKRLYMENIFTVCCTKLWVRFSSLPQKFAVLPLNGSLWLKKVATLLTVVVSYGFLCPPSDAIASAHYIE